MMFTWEKIYDRKNHDGKWVTKIVPNPNNNDLKKIHYLFFNISLDDTFL